MAERTIGHSVKRLSARYIEVRAIRLDELVAELGLERVDFVKIDAEGAELEILKGAVNTLARYSPFVVMSAYHMPLDPIRLAKFLRKMGYVHALIRSHLHALKPSASESR